MASRSGFTYRYPGTRGTGKYNHHIENNEIQIPVYPGMYRLVAIHSTGILYSWRCIVSVLLVMAVLSTWSRVEGVHLLPFYFHHSIFYIDNPRRDIPVCTEAPASIILFPLLGCQCCLQFYSTLCLVTRTLNIRSDTSTTISYNSAKKFNISESNLCSL